MKDFEYYLRDKSVRKATADLERARSLIIDANERIRVAGLLKKDEDFAKMMFENFYDALRDFLDAILLSEGYKSYSHEGSIAYLSKKGFDISEISRLDSFRFKRNGSKYYGKTISLKEAKDINAFYLEIKGKLDKILKGIK